MVARSALLPLALLALAAAALLCGTSAFVGGRSPAASTGSLRATTLSRRALPPGAEGFVAESSLATALAVAAWGMAANIVTVFVPVTFLVVLYLQSERTKAEEGIEP
mmetsp:Transcript_108513/g.324481  ORF Transcript_108513/g.324481 Transcript_108513/m.324481 type:complete len:107 (-) Transcript_108513:100-420(-)